MVVGLQAELHLKQFAVINVRGGREMREVGVDDNSSIYNTLEAKATAWFLRELEVRF